MRGVGAWWAGETSRPTAEVGEQVAAVGKALVGLGDRVFDATNMVAGWRRGVGFGVAVVVGLLAFDGFLIPVAGGVETVLGRSGAICCRGVPVVGGEAALSMAGVPLFADVGELGEHVDEETSHGGTSTSEHGASVGVPLGLLQVPQVRGDLGADLKDPRDDLVGVVLLG